MSDTYQFTETAEDMHAEAAIREEMNEFIDACNAQVPDPMEAYLALAEALAK